MTINLPKLKQERRELEARIREIKKELRSPWTRLMGDSQRELLHLKEKATGLSILRAWVRGRHHLPDVEYCKTVSEYLVLLYQVEELAA